MHIHADATEQSLVIRQFLLGNLYRPADEKIQKFKVPLHILGGALDNLGDFPFKDPDEVRFNKPALFVRGTKSKYVPDEAIPIIGKFFPRFRMVDIDSGHWVTSEKPEDFRRGEFTHPVIHLEVEHVLTFFPTAVVEFLTPQEE